MPALTEFSTILIPSWAQTQPSPAKKLWSALEVGFNRRTDTHTPQRARGELLLHGM